MNKKYKTSSFPVERFVSGDDMGEGKILMCGDSTTHEYQKTMAAILAAGLSVGPAPFLMERPRNFDSPKIRRGKSDSDIIAIKKAKEKRERRAKKRLRLLNR